MSAVADVTTHSLHDLINLSGRTAVVTGAAQGLGKAIARRLAEAGAHVVIGDRNAELAASAAKELDAVSTGTVIASAMDVSDPASVAATAALAEERFGGIDIWVNNAGIFPHVPVTAMEPAQWDEVFAVNSRGSFLGCQAAVRSMTAKERQGVVINIASLAGLRGVSPGLAAYVGSKHAVVGLTKQLALECAPQGIRVLGIAPSFMITEGNMALIRQDPRMAEMAAEAIPSMMSSKLGRVGVADDIARVALFCASDLSLFMTGCTLSVDAGESA